MPGIQQRVRQAAEARPALAASALALYLLERVFWGELSPQEGQRIASLACDDISVASGEDLPNLRALADIGIWAWQSCVF